MNKVFLCDVRYIIKDDRMLGVIPRLRPAKLNLLDDDCPFRSEQSFFQ